MHSTLLLVSVFVLAIAVAAVGRGPTHPNLRHPKPPQRPPRPPSIGANDG